MGDILKKYYIALFSIATTRAVHLEICLDLSTDKFFLALQKFTLRLGQPNTIYTDIAHTFYLANRELRELFTVISAAKTHLFIPPRATWLVGWWERMVATITCYLRKLLGRAKVDEEELQTILAGIESTLNFRQHQRLTEALWRRWQREYLLQLRNYHEVNRPARQGPKFKVVNIDLLQEERTPRHT